MPHPKGGYALEDGTKVPGVTTVLGGLGWNKNQLMWWAWSQGKDGLDFRSTSQTAADIGTVAHAMVEADINKQDIDLSGYPSEIVAAARPAFAAWRAWAEGASCTIVATEAELVSKEHRFGGCLDAVAFIGGKLQILDFKTSKAVYTDHICQIAAYRQLWNENRPSEQLEPGGYILRIGKDGGFAAHYYTQEALDDGWMVFLHARELHDLRKRLEAWV